MHDYSQYGEQHLIEAALGDTKRGTYLDIGAHNGIECSNTRRLWDCGWYGVLVEPTKSRYTEAVKNYNSNAVVFRNAICKESGNVIINNHIDIKDGRSSVYNSIEEILGKENFTQEEVEAITFNDLIDKCHKYITSFNISNIKVISIDAEGEDYNILSSIDFAVIRPKVLVIETGQDYDKIMALMEYNNYRLFARTYANLIFKDE